MSEIAHSRAEPIEINDYAALHALLESRGFNTDQWGVGPTKAVEALWHELEEQESEIIDDGRELVRRTHVAAVDVIAHLSNGQTYQLFEEKQVFKNGAERQRNLITSLGEKMKPGEDTESAVRRAVLEELGITNPQKIELLGDQILHKTSVTYGGIATELLLRMARVTIHEEDFNSAGYVEEQPEKDVVFKWSLVDNSEPHVS